ncbi:hypothetical protein STSP2_01902 [Anaerohalosphaera lusitana]|uniref:Uncharacterized protein n=1 Tax=Anaerohalosphaera lusitana TaxID=1936003 RepID=A0A1U9NMB2_9BACT|nr:hypothetical protein [Anaerohalosphaera lusitana]AQT68730.1 hypothetical protein STSP2_01902 [Anaerohalosphaera lusitana]
MKTQQVVYQQVPLRATVQPVRAERYGTVEGLDSYELADPAELERMAYLRFFEPVLTLPHPEKDRPFMPDIAGGAFDSWDFERMFPGMREYAYRIRTLNWLKSKLSDRLNLLAILKEKLTRPQRARGISAARGAADISEIADPDTRMFASEYRRSLQLRNRIQRFRSTGILNQTPRCR